MKTLSDLKRNMVVGSRWNVFNHRFGKFSTRTVIKSQSNSVCFLDNDGREIWLSYPKSKDLKFTGSICELYMDSELVASYKKAAKQGE